MTTPGDDDQDADLVVCEDCGGDLVELDLGFALADGRWLCAECAAQRGGVYDGRDERWVHAPDVTGLVDLAR